MIIRASQAGNDDFQPANPYDRTFIVTAVEKQAQLINFSSIADKKTTDVPFAINASATSGLPVNYTILSGPATINGNIISLTGNLGRVVVRASQLGNNQYASAPNVDRPFNVVEPLVEEEPNNPAEYCKLISNFPWQEWIGQVVFGDLNQTSGKDIYQFYEQPIVAFEKGKNYDLKVVPVYSWTQWDEYIKVWIDFNQDGDFSDIGEDVVLSLIHI